MEKTPSLLVPLSSVFQYDNVPVLGLPEYDQNLRPVGYLCVLFLSRYKSDTRSFEHTDTCVCHLRRKGEILYELSSNTFVPPDFAASPSNMFLPG